MHSPRSITCVIGPTASGKTARAIAIAQERNGEVISVDSRQVYRTLDIGTEKISLDAMQGVPHHLIDIRDPEERYSAGDFVRDADALIADILSRGKHPVLAGGSHFYFEALLFGLPEVPHSESLRDELEAISTEELVAKLTALDPRRAESIDVHNRRRLIRAIEIATRWGSVPILTRGKARYEVEWVVVDVPRDELRQRIETRLIRALERGLVEEVDRTMQRVGLERLNELGLEYKIVGEYLCGERNYESLLPALSAKLWRYARNQKRWIERLTADSKKSLCDGLRNAKNN